MVGGWTGLPPKAPKAAATGAATGLPSVAAAGQAVALVLQPFTCDALRELIERPLQHPEVYAHLGVAPPRGVLLHGPSGCGKTVLAHAIAGELGGPRGVSFFRVSAPEIVASQVPPRSRSCSK